jgi:hypothetical protein
MNHLPETAGMPARDIRFFPQSDRIPHYAILHHRRQGRTGMHFIVSWDVRAGGRLSPEMNDAMIEGLYGYSWIRLLNAFYIVDIDSGQDWNIIQEKLLSAAQRYPGEINFLMSPIYDCDSNFFVYDMPDEDFYKNT